MELVNRHDSARASQAQVVVGANAVVDGCIRGNEDPKGGAAEHISEWLEASFPNIELAGSESGCKMTTTASPSALLRPVTASYDATGACRRSRRLRADTC